MQWGNYASFWGQVGARNIPLPIMADDLLASFSDNKIFAALLLTGIDHSR